MTNAKKVPTLFCPTTSLTLSSGDTLPDETEYSTVIRSLQYLSLTWPDISFVNKLSQFMHQPRTKHWNAAERILRYLAGMMSQGSPLLKQHTISSCILSGADWGGNHDDYTSTGAYIV